MRDVSRYLAKMTQEECKLAINKWIDEVSEELKFLTKRKEEVEREPREFQNKVRTLK